MRTYNTLLGHMGQAEGVMGTKPTPPRATPCPSQNLSCPEGRAPCCIHEDAVARPAVHLRRCIQVHQLAQKHHGGGGQRPADMALRGGHQRRLCCVVNGNFSSRLLSSGLLPKSGKELKHAVCRLIGLCKFCKIQIF